MPTNDDIKTIKDENLERLVEREFGGAAQADSEEAVAVVNYVRGNFMVDGDKFQDVQLQVRDGVSQGDRLIPLSRLEQVRRERDESETAATQIQAQFDRAIAQRDAAETRVAALREKLAGARRLLESAHEDIRYQQSRGCMCDGVPGRSCDLAHWLQANPEEE